MLCPMGIAVPLALTNQFFGFNQIILLDFMIVRVIRVGHHGLK